MPISDQRRALLPYMKSVYDFQAGRIAAYNRGLDKEGAAPKTYLNQEDKDQFTLWGGTFELMEKAALKKVEICLGGIPVYNDFLSDVFGVGPTMAGVLVACFDPYKARHPSSYWAYTGFALGQEAKCMKCGKMTIVTGDMAKAECWKKRSIKSKGCCGKLQPTGRLVHQRMIQGEPARFNKWLRTKMHVLGEVFVKCKQPEYSPLYYNYKNRIKAEGRVTVDEETGKETPWNDGHYANAALRYMVKMFLLDFWKFDRAEENLPVGGSYQEDKLGHHHGEESPTGSSDDDGGDPTSETGMDEAA